MKIVLIVLSFVTVLISSCANSKQEITIPNFVEVAGEPTLNMRSVKLPSCMEYDVKEFFISGVSNSYKEVKERDSKGNWFVEKKDTASYKTRIVSMFPKDSSKFNGNVIVEWLNVTGGFDFSASFIMMRRELTRSGAAYVGVSVQEVGVQGGPSLMATKLFLKKLKPERYNELHIPGDQYSFDIYSQVGYLLKSKHAIEILGGLKPKHVISIGESQSAMYLTTYVNAIDPIAKAFDGYLIHSRFGFGVPLEGVPVAEFVTSNVPVPMRSELRVPTFTFVTETDVIGAPYGEFPMYGYEIARQKPIKNHCVWELAGAAHHDSYLHKVSAVDKCGGNYEQMAKAFAPTVNMFMAKLDKPFNNGPQHHYVLEAAIVALQKWVSNGVIPPTAEPIKLIGSGTENDPTRPVVDDNGITIGGVRSPWMDVPVSIISGVPAGKNFNSMLIGSTEPFSVEKLNQLYPGGIEDFLIKFEKSLDKQIKAGFILDADKVEILELAKYSFSDNILLHK